MKCSEISSVTEDRLYFLKYDNFKDVNNLNLDYTVSHLIASFSLSEVSCL